MKRIAALLAVFLCAGCTIYSLVNPGRVEIGNTFAVHPDFSWSKFEFGKNETWTVDGMGLQSIQFTKGIKDGDTLYEPRFVKETSPMPEFDKNMSPIEIKDFIIATSTAVGALNIVETNFQPIKLASIDAFRAEFSYTMEDGLDRQGFAIGFVREEKLYVIMYSGAKLHYYGKHKDDVERMLNTIEVLEEN